MWASWLAVPLSSPLLLPPPLALRQLQGLLLRLSYQASFPLHEAPSQERPGLLGHKPEIGTLALGPWVLPLLIQLLLLNQNMSKLTLKLSSVTDFPSSAEKFREVGESQL